VHCCASATRRIHEVDTLQNVTARTLSEAEAATLRATLHRSLSGVMAGVGLTHPSFTRVTRELADEGAAKLGIA
jgi:hypothetical protein